MAMNSGATGSVLRNWLTEMTFRQTMNSATELEIVVHLTQCDAHYRPKLSERVDLPAYGKKLFLRSQRFEMWEGATLAALAAVYFDDGENRRGYISNISVLPEYAGRGIGLQLLQSVEQFAADKGFEELRLETGSDNVAALRLYEKCCFKVFEETSKMVHLRKRLVEHD
jgi:ribosomal protein S18 acetylase RimI-like enzyme